ncbi:putative Ig domain-containing protein, partial [Bacteroidota bacterium]
MKILKAIQYTVFALLLCMENIYAQDFKIAPDTYHPEGNDFHNVSITASDTNGFLITWSSTYIISSTIYRDNYACRISKTGEILDSTAINLEGNPIWKHYCTSTVFAGGNWIIASEQDFLYEWIGVTRLTPSGEILDDPPVNVCWSNGQSTIKYPTIATNGREILCVTGIAGGGLYGSIFDSDLNILVDKFLILADADEHPPYRISANGDNFFITFLNYEGPFENYIKLVIVTPEGEIHSIQNVNEDGIMKNKYGAPAITTLNDTTYITYFNALSHFDPPDLWIRRYSSNGNPIDASSVLLIESPDFEPILDEMTSSAQVLGYTELVWAKEYFRFFWPGVSDPGMSMWSFKSDLSMGNNQPVLLNSQCQIEFHYGLLGYDLSRSIIRASSIGDTILTAWIDGREENPRVYGNLLSFTSPEITSIPDTTAIEDSFYSYQVTAEGTPSPVFGLTVYPESMGIDENNGLITWTPDNSSVGQNEVIVNAHNMYGDDTQSFIITVKNVNDAPILSGIPDLEFNEDDSTTIILSDYAEDVDNELEELTYTADILEVTGEMKGTRVSRETDSADNVIMNVGEEDLVITIDNETKEAMIEASPDSSGIFVVEFIVTDDSLASDRDTINVEVKSLNDTPQITDIPDQEIEEGELFSEIVLDNYVEDIDDNKEDIVWTYSGNVELEVAIDENRIARVTQADEDWFGSEEIVITATDNGGLSDKDTVNYTINPVNDAPV